MVAPPTDADETVEIPTEAEGRVAVTVDGDGETYLFGDAGFPASPVHA